MIALSVGLLVWQRSLPLLLRALFSAANSVPLMVLWSDVLSWFDLTPHILSPAIYWLLPPSASFGLVLLVHWAGWVGLTQRAALPQESAAASPTLQRKVFASEVQRRMDKFL